MQTGHQASFGIIRRVREQTEHPVFEWSYGPAHRLALRPSACPPPHACEEQVVRDVLEHEVVVVVLEVHAVRLHTRLSVKKFSPRNAPGTQRFLFHRIAPILK